MPKFDLIVLGGGSAGLAAARRARQSGATVALVEKDILGGECPNSACVPAKALLRSAAAIVDIRRAAEFGIRVGEPRADWPAVRERMLGIIGYAEGDTPTEEKLRGQQIEVFRGEGVFTSANSVRVDGQTLTSPRIMLTSGSDDKTPPIDGLSETGFLTHKDALHLAALPRSMAIIGAGPVGVEFAQIFAPLGVQVTLLCSGPLPLPREDHAISRVLLDCLRQSDICVQTGIRVESAQRRGALKILTVRDGRGEREVEAEEIFVATGHSPCVENMDFERAGIEADRSGVKVNEQLQTSVPHIWSAGDVTGVALYTHVAAYQAKLAVHNALGEKPIQADYRTIPRATFCRPEVASVGLTEEECLMQEKQFRAESVPFTDIERSEVSGECAGLAKLIVEAEGGQILGGHVIGAHAGELIHEIAVLMHNRVPVSAIACAIHAFPTFSEIWESVALKLE